MFRIILCLLFYCTNPAFGCYISINFFLMEDADDWQYLKLCSVEQTAPPVFGRAAMTLGIGPHSSVMVSRVSVRISVGVRTAPDLLLPSQNSVEKAGRF